MSNDTETHNIDGNEDDAVSLFNQLANSEDSVKDSARDDEQLDQEQDNTGTDEGAEQDTQTEEQPEADPWAAAPEPLRQQYQQLQQSHQKLESDHRANAGRVAALNRKTEELQKALAEREKKNGGEQQDGMPSADDLKGKSFAEVEQEFPEIADFLRHHVEQAKSEITKQLTPLQEHYQQQQAQQQEQQQIQQKQQEYNRLAQVHPDFQKVIVDPGFQGWLKKQPAQLQAIATSDNADDASYVLTQFKRDVGLTKPAPAQKNLEQHVATPRKGSGRAATSAISDDIDPVALFNRLSTSERS
jgi:chromosome segregation ATPase